MFKKVYTFFDKLEDYIRINLSHAPIIYALVGAVGIILLWKGVWEVAERIPGLHGVGSVVMGIIILLASGLLVSFFIGDSILISGFKRSKKSTDRTEKEILESSKSQTEEILTKLDHLEHDIHQLNDEEQECSEKTKPLL